MSLRDLEPIAEKGFPREVKKLLNDCIDRVNRPIKVKFDTNSVNPQATVLQTEDDITIVLPRGLGGSGTTLNLQITKIDNTHIGITAGTVADLPANTGMSLAVSGGTEGSPNVILAQVNVASDDVTFSNLVIFDNGTSGITPDTTHAYKALGNYWTDGSGVLHVNPTVQGSQNLTVCRTPADNFVDPTWTWS